jgi:Flp pilus assembly protein TadG
MTPFFAERGRSARGQSVVELALATPVLVLLLLGAADFGRLFYVWIGVNSAAQAGAQYGSQNVITAANSAGMQLAATTDGANISGLTATASQCTCVSGTSVTVCSGSACFISGNSKTGASPTSAVRRAASPMLLARWAACCAVSLTAPSTKLNIFPNLESSNHAGNERHAMAPSSRCSIISRSSASIVRPSRIRSASVVIPRTASRLSKPHGATG